MAIYTDKDNPRKHYIRLYKDGEPRTRRFTGTEKEALRAEVKFQMELDDEAPAPPPAIPAPAGRPSPADKNVLKFVRFCKEQFMPEARLRFKKKWLKNATYTLSQILTAKIQLPAAGGRLEGDELPWFTLGELPLLRVAQKDVFKAYVNACRLLMRWKKIDGKKLWVRQMADTTINNHMRVYRRVLSYAVAEHFLSTDDVASWEALPEVGETRATAWTPEQVRDLLDECAKVDERIRRPILVSLVVFLLNTGARRGEAIALAWEQVDLDRRIIKFWPSRVWTPKNNKPREVPINDALLPWLQVKRHGTHVFTSRHGMPYADWPTKLYDEAQAAAGLKGGVHQTRHTFASNFLAKTPKIRLLAYILGHSDLTTLKWYEHMLPGHLAEARNVVEVPETEATATALARHRWRAEQGPSKRTKAGRAAAAQALAEAAADPSASTSNVRHFQFPETVPVTVPGTVPEGFSGEGDLVLSSMISTERATGFEPATSSLGSSQDKRKILELLTQEPQKTRSGAGKGK